MTIPRNGLPRYTSTYPRIADCFLEDLQSKRTYPSLFSFQIHRPPLQSAHHSAAKLRRWITYLLLSAPVIPVGHVFTTSAPVHLRKPPRFRERLHWSYQGPGVIEGRPTAASRYTPPPSVTLCQGDGGLNWFWYGPLPALDLSSAEDQRKVRSGNQQ